MLGLEGVAEDVLLASGYMEQPDEKYFEPIQVFVQEVTGGEVNVHEAVAGTPLSVDVDAYQGTGGQVDLLGNLVEFRFVVEEADFDVALEEEA